MQVKCPKCRQDLPADDINVAKDTAYCPACREAFVLSHLVGADDAEPEIDPGNPPPGCRVEPLPDGFVITASARSAQAGFMIFFALFWNSIVSVFVVSALINLFRNGLSKPLVKNAPFPGFEFLFMIPFVLVGLATAAIALTQVAGQVRVLVQGDNASIFTGIGTFGWARRFAWSELRSVTEEYVPGNRGGARTHIVLTGRKRLRFGWLLRDDRRHYVLSVLRQVLAGKR